RRLRRQRQALRVRSPGTRGRGGDAGDRFRIEPDEALRAFRVYAGHGGPRGGRREPEKVLREKDQTVKQAAAQAAKQAAAQAAVLRSCLSSCSRRARSASTFSA